MHTVIETPTYISGLKTAGIGDDERQGVVNMLAADPKSGALIEGAGGARKVRCARSGGGKSGGYRVITFFGGEDVPVFLLDVFSKGDRATLSARDKNALAKALPEISAAYRAGSRAAARKTMKEGRSA